MVLYFDNYYTSIWGVTRAQALGFTCSHLCVGNEVSTVLFVHLAFTVCLQSFVCMKKLFWQRMRFSLTFSRLGGDTIGTSCILPLSSLLQVSHTQRSWWPWRTVHCVIHEKVLLLTLLGLTENSSFLLFVALGKSAFSWDRRNSVK